MDAVQHPPDVALATVHHAEEVLGFNLAKSKRILRELRKKQAPCNHNRLVRKFCSCSAKERKISDEEKHVALYQAAMDGLKKGDYQPAVSALNAGIGDMKEPPEEKRRLQNRLPIEKHRVTAVPTFYSRMLALERKLKELEGVSE